MEDQAALQTLSEITASGTFMVEVSPEVHERLIREALERGISLNELAAERLAASPAPVLRSAEDIVGGAVAGMGRTIGSVLRTASGWLGR